MSQPNQYSVKYITAKEAERMFKYYRAVSRQGGKTEVARKFKRSISAVNRLSVREGWNARVEKIEANISKDVDKKIVREEITNLKLVRAAKSLVGKKVLSDKEAKATITELIALVRLEEELLENLPGDPNGGGNVVNVINDNTELARILANAQIGLRAVASTNSDRLSPL